MENKTTGTLAVDLGNTNTVIAFQGEKESNSVLIQIPSITSHPGIIPTAVWCDDSSDSPKIGISALKMKNNPNAAIFFHSNFKRFIGNTTEKYIKKKLYSSNYQISHLKSFRFYFSKTFRTTKCFRFSKLIKFIYNLILTH